MCVYSITQTDRIRNVFDKYSTTIHVILYLSLDFFSFMQLWIPRVDIKEGFWHISICPTFNRKLKLKKNIFRLQLLLAEG